MPTDSLPTPSPTALLPSELARFDEVCRFGQDKLESVARTVAASFADDPVWQWIYDTGETIPVETGIVLARLLVAQSMPVDEIHGFRHFGAVALWTAPKGTTSIDYEALRAERVEPYFGPFGDQLGERLAITGRLSEAMKQLRPSEPHWYLGILGTHPDRQNQGLGSWVLRVMHDRCDRIGVPSYLESSNPRNYGFYRRHGYVEHGEVTVAGSPKLLGFLRSPR